MQRGGGVSLSNLRSWVMGFQRVTTTEPGKLPPVPVRVSLAHEYQSIEYRTDIHTGTGRLFVDGSFGSTGQ